MPRSPMQQVVQHLRLAVQAGADLTDGQLLECFLSGREEVAFEALVRRYGAMVLGVCRRVVRHAQDAEDAFQATFLVLAQKASAIWPREKVGHWLYGVAYRIALRTRAASLKRHGRERPIAEGPEPQATPPLDAPDWLPTLDRELHGLPAKYRVPIVLCDLQGKTQQEAARQLGWREGTLSGRLSRARALLGRRLARRGIVLSVPAFTAALATERTAAQVPPALIAAVAKSASFASLNQAIAAGAVSARVAALAQGVLKIMIWTNLKTGLIGLIALAVVAVGLGRTFYSAAEKPELGKSLAGKKAPGPQAASGPLQGPPPAASRPVLSKVPSDKEKELIGKLAAIGKFSYDKASLEQVLDGLRKDGVNVVVDVGDNRPDVILSLQLQDVPLETALRYLLKPADLDFIVQDGVLLITNRSKAFVRKVYPVAHLLGKEEDNNSRALIQVITKTIDPGSWEGGDSQGQAAIEWFPGTKSLVILQSWEMHREIEALLRDLAPPRSDE